MSDESGVSTLSDPVGAGDGRGADPAGAGLAGVNGKGPLWQGYAGGVDLGDVARAFRAKFGYEPVEVRWSGCVFLAGPIGERPRTLTQRAAEAQRAAVELSAAEAAERAQQLALQLEV